MWIVHHSLPEPGDWFTPEDEYEKHVRIENDVYDRKNPYHLPLPQPCGVSIYLVSSRDFQEGRAKRVE